MPEKGEGAMAKYRAIPPGFMTVGEAAKKMGVTVRTLQYYDLSLIHISLPLTALYRKP